LPRVVRHEETCTCGAGGLSTRTNTAKKKTPRTEKTQPGADKNAIVVELDENAIARHLLEVLDFGPPPGK